MNARLAVLAVVVGLIATLLSILLFDTGLDALMRGIRGWHLGAAGVWL
jgi:hypothetical protein